MIQKRQGTKSSTLDIWLCNTYQSLLLMNKHSERKPWERNRLFLIVPSKDRINLKKEASKILRRNAKLLSELQFWLLFAYLLLKKEPNLRLFLPHRERNLFSSHISGILYIIFLRLTPEEQVRYYDEGLSFLHILAGTKGYAKESDLRNNPLLCLPCQKDFYQCLDIGTGLHKRGSLIECCQQKDIETTDESPHREDGAREYNLHLISSAFLDYEVAYKLTDMIRNHTNRWIIYPHPNKIKNSPEPPREFDKIGAQGIVEIELERGLRKGDFVFLGLTSLLPFLVWLSEQRRLSLNIAIILSMSKSSMAINSHKLIDIFIACTESQKKHHRSITIEGRSSKLILLGVFPFSQSDILSML